MLWAGWRLCQRRGHAVTGDGGGAYVVQPRGVEAPDGACADEDNVHGSGSRVSASSPSSHLLREGE